jgi:hypothetical protein
MSYYLPFQDLSRVLNFKDIGGKSINAVDVFALCIEYIKDIIFKKIKNIVIIITMYSKSKVLPQALDDLGCSVSARWFHCFQRLLI